MRPRFTQRLQNVGRLLFGGGERAPEVDPADAQRLANEGAVILDVREAGERRRAAIPGSVHVPLAELEARLDEVPRDRPVVVHCALGSRSALAARRLKALGFDDVRNLRGGLRAWKDAGLTVAPDGPNG